MRHNVEVDLDNSIEILGGFWDEMQIQIDFYEIFGRS